MNQPIISRRVALFGAAALALAANRTSAQSTPVASPTAAAFPVTIKHLYGETTIESASTRVVTLGWSTSDAVIALGLVPVGIPADTWAGDADGFLPWTRAAIGDAALPAALDTAAGIPFEAIAALNPDLILAPYSGVTEEEYETLSKIAPTVPPKDGLWASSWQDLTRVTGLVLGLAPEAEQLIADTDAYVASEAAKFPALAGKSFVYGNMGDGTTSFNIYTNGDPRPQFLESMGLVPSELVEELSADPENLYYGTVSYELANTIVADIVVFWFTDEAEHEAAIATSYYQAIPAVAAGTFAAIIGREYVMATSAFSTLSIAFALGEFLPTLAAAAANA
ncbi:ABC transporter substrate-binding protein [soil metagenome]